MNNISKQWVGGILNNHWCQARVMAMNYSNNNQTFQQKKQKKKSRRKVQWKNEQSVNEVPKENKVPTKTKQAQEHTKLQQRMHIT